MGRFGLFLVCALCPRCLCDEELRKAVGAAQLPVTPIAVAVLLHTTPTTKQLLLDSFHWLTRLHNTTVIFVDDATNRTELKPVNGTAHVFEFTVDAAIPYKAGFWGASSQHNMYLRNKEHGPSMRRGDVQALEKALFLFCVLAPHFEQVWLLEDDVFVPSLRAYDHMNIVTGEADLVSQVHRININTTSTTWLWPYIHLQLPPPWHSGGATVIRLSKRLLHEVHAYARRNGRLEYCEALFNSLAGYANLTVSTPPFLSTCGCCWKPTCENVTARPLNWFHPVKKQAEFVGLCALHNLWNLSFY